MKDNEIISLFELRDEHAIEALSDKYHPYPSIDAQSAEISITKVQLGYAGINLYSEYRPVCNAEWRDCYPDRFCSGSGIPVCFF